MKTKFLILFFTLISISFFAQTINTQNKYGSKIVEPTVNNILFALLDSNKFISKITSELGYTKERDGNYYAATGVGSPYYTVGFSYREIQLIWTNDGDLNRIAANELQNISNPYYSDGFYHYSTKLKNGYTLNITFKPNTSGGGSILAVLK